MKKTLIPILLIDRYVIDRLNDRLVDGSSLEFSSYISIIFFNDLYFRNKFKSDAVC